MISFKIIIEIKLLVLAFRASIPSFFPLKRKTECQNNKNNWCYGYFSFTLRQTWLCICQQYCIRVLLYDFSTSILSMKLLSIVIYAKLFECSTWSSISSKHPRLILPIDRRERCNFFLPFYPPLLRGCTGEYI